MKIRKEALREMQERFNFLNQDFMERIEKVEVFFEDCENCDMKDECPNKDEYGVEGKVLEGIHEVFSKRGVDSNIHPMTSSDNGEFDEVVCKESGIVPVNAFVTESGPVCTPDHNFLMIELEDGKKYLYTLDMKMSEESEQDEVKAPLMYR